MYAENVDIYVDGKRVTILVPCVPNTPKNELKKMAIDIYIHRLRNKLIVQNLV